MATVALPHGRLGALLMKHARDLPKVIRRGAKLGAQHGRTVLVKRTPVYEGQMKNAWQPASGDDIVLENTAPHAGIVERGARPHPVSKEGLLALQVWAEKKLGLDEKEAKSVAWVIAQRIREHGQAGTYFVRDSLPELVTLAREDIEKALAKHFDAGEEGSV